MKRKTKKTLINTAIAFVFLGMLSATAFMWIDMYDDQIPAVQLGDKPSDEAPPDAAPEEDAETAKQPIKAPEGVSKTEHGYAINDITLGILGCEIKNNASTGERNVIISYQIENNSDEDFGYSSAAWKFTLQDGYQVDRLSYLIDFLPKYVPAGEKVSESVSFKLESTIELNTITATYEFLNYDDQVMYDLSKLMLDETTDAEYKEAYPDLKALDFKLKLN